MGRSQQKYSTESTALVPLAPNTIPTNLLKKKKKSISKTKSKERTESNLEEAGARDVENWVAHRK